jgi:SAM-dependent methyltransferase
MIATNAVPMDSSNVEQLRAWDGGEGEHWADNAEYFDRSVAPYHERLLAVAAIGESDRVLDIGCGTGQTTRDAARAASAGSAFGVDLSSRMLDYASRRAALEGLTNVGSRRSTRRSTPSSQAATTWPSAAPPPWSSAITLPPSPTSVVTCARVDGWYS